MAGRGGRHFRFGLHHLRRDPPSPAAIPWLVGLYITAAYWFTASTSFANPAVAIARSFTDTFSGIRPFDLPGFVTAQFAGALIGVAVAAWLFTPERPKEQTA